MKVAGKSSVAAAPKAAATKAVTLAAPKVVAASATKAGVASRAGAATSKAGAAGEKEAPGTAKAETLKIKSIVKRFTDAELSLAKAVEELKIFLGFVVCLGFIACAWIMSTTTL
jgi:hypothetical protein